VRRRPSARARGAGRQPRGSTHAPDATPPSRRTASPHPASALGTPVAVAALVVAADQATKQWALSALDDGPVDLFWTLRFNLTFNSGASFSIGSGRGGLIAVVGLLALVIGFRSVLRWPGRLAPFGLGLVAGGALGNLTDRVFRDGDGFLGGRVVDFIDPQWWPVFNLADIGIFLGGGLLVLASLKHPQPTPVP
jgi:signal peptidase II